MSETSVVVGAVWQGDLHKVYLDPLVGPRDIRCYIPEQHASRKCGRAIKGGQADTPADPQGPWCDLCTVAKREHAARHTSGREAA